MPGLVPPDDRKDGKKCDVLEAKRPGAFDVCRKKRCFASVIEKFGRKCNQFCRFFSMLVHHFVDPDVFMFTCSILLCIFHLV